MSCYNNTKFNPKPHIVEIFKNETGFGFNVKGQVSEGGQLRSINGDLYPPLQFVSAVLSGGAADQAGLLFGDKIIEVNGINVEGVTHRRVVELIREGGDQLRMKVISVDTAEIERDNTMYAEESPVCYRYDYSEKRSLPITIPTCQKTSADGCDFTVFDINMAGRHLGSRRYSEFVQLNKLLKEEFPDFPFPKLPKKWPWKLSEQQLDSRRRMLEQYLERICAVKVIADCEIVQEFLMEEPSPYTPMLDVNLRVLLDNDQAISIDVKRHADSQQVYAQIAEEIKLSLQAMPYCALFEMVDGVFERKLYDRECPHNIYIQNYNSAASSCILLRKWCFNLQTERELCRHDKLFQRICYYQAISEVNSGTIQARESLYKLKALQTEDRCEQYLEMARKLEGYSRVIFPQCTFTIEEEKGIISLSVDFNEVIMKLIEAESKKAKTVRLKWNFVKDYTLLPKSQIFVIVFGKENETREMRLLTSFADYCYETFERIKNERIHWSMENNSAN